MKRQSVSVRSLVLALFFALILAGGGHSAYAQQGKVSVNIKNGSLKEFFNAIEEQTDYNFSYRDSELEGKPSVTVKAEDAELSVLLSAELAKAGLQYTFMNDKIVITPKRHASSLTNLSTRSWLP